MTVTFGFDGDLKQLADAVERVRNTEVLAGTLARDRQGPRRRRDGVGAVRARRLLGTHAIGHARMATESDVDIANAHPYWAYLFPDVAVVHNGQLTNFHDWRGACSGPATGSSPTATRRSSRSTSPRR